MKTAIVTGANGFIGSAVVRELLQHDYHVYAVCRRNSSSNVPESNDVEIVFCNLDEMRRLQEAIPARLYDCFYHLAWEGIADAGRDSPEIQIQNVQWTIEALRVAQEIGCERFVGAGSIMERESLAGMLAQGSYPGRGDIYGGSKLLAHIMCKSIAAHLGIDILWGKITNAYGPGENNSRLINSTIRKCLRGESPQFTSGVQNYDFVYIDDVARAFRLIGENGKSFHEYTIGSSTARPLKEFLLEMHRAVAPEIPFGFGNVPFSGVNLPLAEFDCAQTEADTGFRAQIDFVEGCMRTVKSIETEKYVEQKHP